MALSPLSRFQGCLLLALGGDFLAKFDSQERLSELLQPWTDILQQPYQAPLSWQFWQNLPPKPTEIDLAYSLVILALYHHENPLGFHQDLSHWREAWQKLFPQFTWTEADGNAILLWQRLLTLILSERFHFAQLPDLLKTPDQCWGDGPIPEFSQDLLNDLTAIADYLENRQPINLNIFHRDQPGWSATIGTTIYLWSKHPAQPRLMLKQLEKSQKTAIATNNVKGLNPIIAPLTLALGGAYNGNNISQKSLAENHCPPFHNCLNSFSQQLWQRWSGQLHPNPPGHLQPLATSAPLGMQRRSSLKLVSQQNYGQFSSTNGN